MSDDLNIATETIDHADVFGEALDVYQQREIVHRALWRSEGLRGLADCATHAKNKAMRLQNFNAVIAAESVAGGDVDSVKKEAIDAALDLINYGAFCARLLKESMSTRDTHHEFRVGNGVHHNDLDVQAD